MDSVTLAILVAFLGVILLTIIRLIKKQVGPKYQIGMLVDVDDRDILYKQMLITGVIYESGDTKGWKYKGAVPKSVHKGGVIFDESLDHIPEAKISLGNYGKPN